MNTNELSKEQLEIVEYWHGLELGGDFTPSDFEFAASKRLWDWHRAKLSEALTERTKACKDFVLALYPADCDCGLSAALAAHEARAKGDVKP